MTFPAACPLVSMCRRNAVPLQLFLTLHITGLQRRCRTCPVASPGSLFFRVLRSTHESPSLRGIISISVDFHCFLSHDLVSHSYSTPVQRGSAAVAGLRGVFRDPSDCCLIFPHLLHSIQSNQAPDVTFAANQDGNFEPPTARTAS